MSNEILFPFIGFLAGLCYGLWRRGSQLEREIAECQQRLGSMAIKLDEAERKLADTWRLKYGIWQNAQRDIIGRPKSPGGEIPGTMN